MVYASSYRITKILVLLMTLGLNTILIFYFLYLQDTYDITEDDEDDHHDQDHIHDASSDNFYDAPTEKDGHVPEVRIDLSASDDPQDRLIAAIAALKEVIVDNTNIQRTGKRKRGQERSGGAGGRANGGLKDERLKVRKEKVRFICISKKFRF